MASEWTVFTFVVLTLSLLCGAEKEGEVAWVYGGIDDMKIVKEVTYILNSLNSMNINDSIQVDKVFSLIYWATQKLGVINKLNDDRKAYISDSMNSMKNFNSIEVEMIEFQRNIKEIKKRYDQMKTLAHNIADHENSTLKAFAEWNIRPSSDSVSSILSDVFFTYFGDDNREYIRIPLVDKITKQFKDGRLLNLCPSISAQQIFYVNYLEFTILLMEGYLIEKFSWTVLRNLGKEMYRAEEHDFLAEYEKNSIFMRAKLRNALDVAEREIITCDPDHWEEKVNYEQLTRLIQGYVVNEVNLNEKLSCSNNCQDYKDTAITKCFDNDPYCHKDRGTGRILRCESDSNSDDIFVCPSNDPNRRYEYIHSNRNSPQMSHLYGRRGSCPKYEKVAWSWIRGVFRCSYCFCLIDEKSEKSDRFFNLRKVVSDVNENKIVTGVRFVKKNRVIYLQIQQGELAPFGMLKKLSTAWKDVEEYELENTKNGIDYVTLDSDHRSVYLNSAQTKNSSYVVTGIKFHMVRSHLAVKVKVTKYDFETGKLITPDITSYWISNYPWQTKSVPWSSNGPKVSTEAPGKSVLTSSTYNSVEFTHSNKHDDVSQTTLPFIDTQDVISHSPTPLAGVGLYHKGLESQYGGFIAPKIITIDFLPFV